MAGQLLTTAQTIFAILLASITIAGLFYKQATSRAKLEADLRNEIEKLEEKNKDMAADFEKLLTRFDAVTQELRATANQGLRISGLENMFNKIDGKMDEFNRSLNNMDRTFNDKLGQINISLAGKQDKKFT